MSYPKQVQKPSDPVAKTAADLLTFKQGVAIRVIANSQGLFSEDVCQREFHCGTDRLSRAAASWLIDHLKGLSTQRLRKVS